MKTLLPNPDSTTSFSIKFAKVRLMGWGRLPGLAGVLALAATMGAPSALAQQTQPVSQLVIVADFNHDGIPDALVQSTVTPTATIAFGSVPYGTFGGNVTAVTFPAACTSLPAGSVAVGDFNGDGFPDIAYFCGTSAGTILGKGDGTFGASVTLPGVATSSGIAGDFNNDGKIDIAVLSNNEGANGNGQAIRFLSGKGDGTFNQPLLSNLAVNTYSTLVAIDLNADGYPDLALINSSPDVSASLEVLSNNKNGTFGVVNQGLYSANTVASLPFGGTAAILVGSFFGAATADVAVVNTGVNGQLFTFKNTSSGTTYSLADPVSSPVANLTGAQAGRFTGSGFTDIAVSNATSIAMLANDGSGNFTASYPTLTLASTTSRFAVADANNDGYADIYTASLPASGPLQLGVNLTTGSATATSQPISLAIGTKAISAAWVGNVNFTGSSVTGSQIVVGLPSTTTLTSSKNPSLVGGLVSFSVHVAPAASSTQTPAGNVVLTDGTTILASGALDGAGNFAYSTSSLTQATHALTATYGGNALYAGSFGTVAQVVNHAAAVAPTVTWTPQAIIYGTPLSGLQLSAVATGINGTIVPGVFAYTPAAGTILDAGTQTLSVTFTPTDLLSFNVVSKTVSLVVSKATPVVSWATPASIVYGTPVSATQLNAVATGINGVTLAGAYTYAPPAGTLLNAGTQTLSVLFTPTNLVNYAATTRAVTLIVTKATPVITWATPASVAYPTPLSATQLNATASGVTGGALQGTFSYTPAAGTIPAAGTQTLSVSFMPEAGPNYTTATSSVQLVVTGATTTATTLTVTSGGNPVTTVASGAVITLTATVKAGATAVSPGQVAFCDATALTCTGLHLLGTAQLVQSGAGVGTATYRFVPGLGAHSYVAMFLATKTAVGSASGAATLAVTGTHATATTLAQSGVPGNYTLTATTVGKDPYAAKTETQSVTIKLGQSAQNYVLTGTGPSTMNGGTYGNYYNTQGSCVTTGSITTCDLTGNFTSSTSTYAAGTYDFQTIFSGSISSAVPSQTQYSVGTQEPNDFFYTGFAPSTTMTLKLNVTGGGSYSIPMVANGNFVPSLDGIGLAYTSTACGGTPLGSLPCQQDYVGTVVGATYSGPVTGTVQFEMPSLPALRGPTGTVSFLDTSNANATLASSALGASTVAFSLVQPVGSVVTVGTKPYGVATGDFNGDGFADTVVENYYAGTVSVLLGKGDGTFQPQVTYAVGVQPERVLVADLNGDGKLDLVVANTGSNTVSVLLGKGDGTFQAQATYPCSSPVGLGVLDLNHDGIPDVVAGDYYNNTISVLLGKGDGTLQTAVPYATGSTPQAVAEGDFNGDGNIDVVVGNEGGATVGVFLGNGDGTFQAMVTFGVGNQPQGVQVGDFNGDGQEDLAVTNHGDGTIGVLLGKGDGTFQTQVTYAVGVQPVGLAIADFNGDGIEDITVGNTGQASLTQGVLLGKGDGTFQAQMTFPTGNFPYGVAVADFNGDGLPDMAVANFNDATATIFLSLPTAIATAKLTGVSPQGPGTHEVVASYPGDAHYGASVSPATALVVVGTTPTVITWTPAVTTISYGTALGTSQLNATAATAAGVAIPGTFTYTPKAETVLSAGSQTLTVAFTPTDPLTFSSASMSVSLTVLKATPAITWATPTSIAYGTALSATQLNATAAGVNGAGLTGKYTYTPGTATVLAPGTQTLSVSFVPDDTTDYTAATSSVNLIVTGVTVASFTPKAAILGSGATTMTVTGAGFAATTVVQVNGTAILTTVVNPTTLTAVIPASYFKAVGPLTITLSNPGITTPIPVGSFNVTASQPVPILAVPPTTDPGTQPTVTLSLAAPYPVDIMATVSLSFAASTTPAIDDPAIVFEASGTRTQNIPIPAGTTTVPAILLQAGTVAGTITVPITLTAGGVNVTPANLTPGVIIVPAAVPMVSSVKTIRSGERLTVVVHGFSNTREMVNAKFHFTPAVGATLSTTDFTIPADAIFNTKWFQTTASDEYGSTFTYTQIFDLSDDATTVSAVDVTLANSVGASDMKSAQ